MVDESYLKDLFEVDGPIPDGVVYQWRALSFDGGMKEIAAVHLKIMAKAGWTAVPWERHPTMSRGLEYRDNIVVGEQILMECNAEAALAARAREISSATSALNKSANHVHDLFGFCGRIGSLLIGGGLERLQKSSIPEMKVIEPPDPLYPEKLEAARKSVKTIDGVSYVDIVLGAPLTESEIQTAVHLGLDLQEYARRRILMRKREQSAPVVLMEIAPGVFDFADIKVDRKEPS
jgi:hypothetical protein